MAIHLSLSAPGKLVSIEDDSVTTASASVTVTAVNDNLWVYGLNDMTFVVTDTDGNDQTMTVPTGTKETLPFMFKKITYAALTGTSGFRMRALQLTKIPGR